MLAEGDKLPKLALLDDRGETVRTGELAGQMLVLYFYPKDDTSG